MLLSCLKFQCWVFSNLEHTTLKKKIPFELWCLISLKLSTKRPSWASLLSLNAWEKKSCKFEFAWLTENPKKWGWSEMRIKTPKSADALTSPYIKNQTAFLENIWSSSSFLPTWNWPPGWVPVLGQTDPPIPSWLHTRPRALLVPLVPKPGSGSGSRSNWPSDSLPAPYSTPCAASSTGSKTWIWLGYLEPAPELLIPTRPSGYPANTGNHPLQIGFQKSV